MRPLGRSAAWVGPLVFLGGLLVAVPGAFFAYKWIAEDQEDVYG